MVENRNILISIIIPVYNVEKYIRKCLDSIIGQISDDCEVVIIDDGSTDCSGEICDEYSQKQPSLFRVYHKENQGAYPTRNYALDRAVGEYVWLIDPDDIVEKDAIANIRDIITNNDNLDIIIAAFRKFNDNWVGEIENSEAIPKVVSGEEYLTEGRFDRAYLWYHVYNREFLVSNNIRFNDNLNTQGDWLFNTYAYISAKRIFLSDKLIYNYYQGNPNSTLARRDPPHLMRGVENSLTAILEMNNICESQKGKAIYEFLRERLSLTLSGFLYSLYRFYFPTSLVKKVLSQLKANKLYPIWKCNNRKANVFITFANCEWLFVATCYLKTRIHGEF